MRSFWTAIMGVLIVLASCDVAFASAKKDRCPQTEWSAACFDHTPDGRRVKPQYLGRIAFQKNGFAVLYVRPGETVAVNKKGEVVVPGIASGNYDYRDAEGGIAMFVIPNEHATGKLDRYSCGYFQLSNFNIVVPPVYNQCDYFHHQTGYVCKNCRPDCSDCNEMAYYGDGEAYVINAKNEILKRVALPKLPLCSTVEEVGGYPADQQCRKNRAGSPEP